MRRLFFALWVVSSSLWAHESTPSLTTSFTPDAPPSTFVNSVHVVSGSFYFSGIDCFVPGPVALNSSHYYNSDSLYPTWFGYSSVDSNFPVSIVISHVNSEKSLKSIIVDEGSGTIAAYEADRKPDDSRYSLSSDSVAKGFSNVSGGYISGRTNLKNTHYYVEKQYPEEAYIPEYFDDLEKRYRNMVKPSKSKSSWLWTGYMADGSTRFYGTTNHATGKKALLKEVRPDGNKLYYQYHKDGTLKGIQAKDRTGKQLLNSLAFSYDGHKRRAEIHSSNGKFVTYHFKNHYSSQDEKVRYVETIESSDTPTVHFEYIKDKHKPDLHRVEKVAYPEGKFLFLEYDNEGKVIAQKAPAGKNGEKRTIWKFEYHDRFTDVFDAEGHRTSYSFSPENRVTWIKKYTKKDKLYRGEFFHWVEKRDIKEGYFKHLHGNLLSKAIIDETGKALFCWKASYDKFGNITKTSIFGNLTGNCHNHFDVTDYAEPDTNHIECYSNYASFNTNSRFLLKTKEWEDAGPAIEYTYHSRTDLLSAKYTFDGNAIKIREFFDYDNTGVVIKKIIDNGTCHDKNDLQGVSERRITYIKPVSVEGSYGVGQPKEITEMYLDKATKKEYQLKREVFFYDKAGRVLQRDVYDSNNTFAYSTRSTYDAQGNILSTTDPIGRTVVYAYDKNNNRTREELVGSSSYTTFAYDAMNRLVTKEEHHPDITLTTTHEYDLSGNIIATTDPFGNTTQFGYDEFNRRVVTTYPDKEQEKVSYTIFDKTEQITDANGNITVYKRNCRGDPIKIIYPDGDEESFEYNLNGTLKNKGDRNGTKHKFSYDGFKRPIEEKVYDAKDEKHLYTVHNEYNSFHLISTTDPMGFVTTYTYDDIGRKVVEKKESGQMRSQICYGYDSLGRQNVQEIWYGLKKISTAFGFDALNREIEKKVHGNDGTLICHEKTTYDIFGNIASKERYRDTSASVVTSTIYNSKNLPIETCDEEGNKTTISYNYNFQNDKGQKVLQSLIQDPLGVKTIQTYDSRNRCVLLEKRNGGGVLLSKSQCEFDGCGNKKRQVDTIIIGGQETGSYTVAWEYDECNRQKTLIEEPKRALEKRTLFSYKKGLLQAVTKPNGVTLQHHYDGLGRLSHLTSSDKTIDYEYSYDLHGNNTSVVDNVHNEKIKKEYDPWDHLTKEIFPTFPMEYVVDVLGRVHRLTLPDKSSIDYYYIHDHLSDVVRYSPDRTKLYYHSYTKIDLEENVLESALPGSLGTMTTSWNKRGYRTHMQGASILEDLTGIDACGNITRCILKDPLGTIDAHFDYDGLSQLISEDGVENHVYCNNSLSSRLTMDGKVYGIDNHNRMVQSPTSSCAYDKNGNLVTETINGSVRRYYYDALDRIIQVMTDTWYADYRYDNMNRRISKKVFIFDKPSDSWKVTTDEKYIYQGNREIGALDTQGKITSLRVLGRGKGAEIGASVAIELQGVPYVPINDHRGNIVALYTLQGTPQEFIHYSAFGTFQVYQGSGEKAEQSLSPWLFASKRYDAESGLFYFGARYYNPIYGRWITADPLDFADGQNLYAYVHNNPVSLRDPYGLLSHQGDANFEENEFQTNEWVGSRPGEGDDDDVEYHNNESVPTGCTYEHYLSYFNRHDGEQSRAEFQHILTINTYTGDSPELRALRRDSLDQSRRYRIQGLETDGGLGFVNGINNNEMQAVSNGRYLHNLANGTKIRGVYNYSNGLARDLPEARDNFKGFCSRPVQLIRRDIEEFCAEHPDASIHYLIVCHSQGVIQVRNALRRLSYDQQQRVLVLAVAPAAYISKNECLDVVHLVSAADGVPQLNVRGNEMASNEHTVRILEGSTMFNQMHSFQEGIYRRKISDYVHEYLANPRMTRL